MDEFDANDISTETFFKNLKTIMGSDTELYAELYTEIKSRLEDIDDIGKLNDFQIYEKAYKNDEIYKCVDIILKIALKNPSNLKKSMLRTNCLKNPMGMKYDEADYKKTMQIMEIAHKTATNQKYESQIIKQLTEMILYTHCFYHNNQTNTKRLQQNTFSQYSLSKQLRMICIFIQDQSRLMLKALYKDTNKINLYNTGMEMNIANISVDHSPQEKISFSDNYEGLLEYFNTIIHYIYYSRKKDLQKNDTNEHGNIHHFGIPAFQELTYIAQQRRMYEQLEEKFRYGEWSIHLTKDKYNHSIYFFKPERIDKSKSHITASIRREYQFKTAFSRQVNISKAKKTLVAIEKLSQQIDLNNIELFEIDENLYQDAKNIAFDTISVYKDQAKEYYFQCKFGEISVNDLMHMYEFLYTYSQIYIQSISKVFNQRDYTTYKFLVPVINSDYLLNEFVRLYKYEKKLAQKLLKNFIYHEHLKKEDGDIFSRPLLKINQKQVLLCETLIEQINIERSVEQWLKKYNVDLTPVGHQFEQNLRQKLASIDEIKVNTNKFTFIAFDKKDVEFDFIGTFDDYLLLFEFKSVLIPYDESEVLKREEVIKEGVDQIKRRCKVIQHDWNKIRENVNIPLPEKPYSDSKIIKLVCTNIYDFTTLTIDGIMVTDESTLLKYFTNPFVTIYSTGYKSPEVLGTKFLWKNGKPSVSEFMDYLKKPVTIGRISECLKNEIKTVPPFKDDYFVAFEDAYLTKDPFREEIDQILPIIKGKKTYPNDPCPCGSGKKYKKCCGKPSDL